MPTTVTQEFQEVSQQSETNHVATEKGGTKPSSDVATQTVDESQVVSISQSSNGVSPQDLVGNGFTYRHDWGNYNGSWKLNLNWGSITPNSRVFVAIAEGAPGGGKFIGAAKYTLHNVAPGNGVVSIWVTIDYSSPIRLYVDYLIVNP